MTRIPLSALIGLIVTGAFFLSAILAPLISPYGMAEIVGDVWEPRSAEHWLGTDAIGRDLLTRLIWGGQTTIFVAAAATAVSFIGGSVLGFLAAVTGGWIDQVLSRLNDLLMAIPALILALVILSVMPATLTVLILVMGVLDATRVFRLSRAVAVDITVMDYVEAGRLRVLDTHVPFNHQVALHTNTDALPIPAVGRVLDVIREVFGTVLVRDPAGS